MSKNIVELKTYDRGELQVKMSHVINKASLGLSVIEKRIIYLFIVEFCKKKRTRGFNGETIILADRMIKIRAEEYAATFNVDPKNAYRDLKKAAKSFLSRHWTLHKPDGGVRMGNWLEAIDYRDEEGYVTAIFTGLTTPHLVMENKERFITYRLKAAASLTGSYAWRLWDLLSQYADPTEKYKSRNQEHWVKISLDEFRHMMEIPKSYRYPDIRIRVIEPAIKQIKEKNEINVEWKPFKKGRAVDSLEFKYTPSSQLTLFGASYE